MTDLDVRAPMAGWSVVVVARNAISVCVGQTLESLGAQTVGSIEELSSPVTRPAAALLDVGTGEHSITNPVWLSLEAIIPRPLVLGMTTEILPASLCLLRQGKLDGLVGRPPAAHELHWWSIVCSGSGSLLRLAARHAVGTLEFGEAQEIVRQSMLGQALSGAKGNRRLAARLLGVSRRQIQLLVAARRIWNPT